MLLAASVAAILVYSVRRHRTDDYQGHYRIWCWAAACWFLIATDQAASLREAFRDSMISLTGTTLLGDGTLWWIVAYALVLGSVGSRLLVDMWTSRLSVAALSGAAVVHVVAVAFQLNWIVVFDGNLQILLFTICQMSGNLMLLAAMLLHARYVLLDAEGLLPKETAEPIAEEDDVDDSESTALAGDQWKKIDSPHGTPQPVFQRVPTAQPVAVAAAAPPASTSFTPPINRKLTKGEKKALKEKLMRERAERERRGL